MIIRGFETRWSHPDPTSLFFSIPIPVSFKKLNGNERGEDEKIHKLAPFTFDFCFCFLFFYIYFYLLY